MLHLQQLQGQGHHWSPLLLLLQGLQGLLEGCDGQQVGLTVLVMLRREVSLQCQKLWGFAVQLWGQPPAGGWPWGLLLQQHLVMTMVGVQQSQ